MDTRCRVLIYTFQSVCWLATGVLLCYWIYLFALDEDVCFFDYRKYYKGPDDEFPVLSFCLKNPFSEEKLRGENSEIDSQSYGNFLLGKNYSPIMQGMNYSNVLIDASKYVDQYYIEWRNGTFEYISVSNETRKLLIQSFSGAWNRKFYGCFSLQTPPNTEISTFAVQISSYIFPGGVRTNKYIFMTVLHARNQFLISKTHKWMYPRREPSDSYVLRYKLKGVEKIKRRNKRNHKCYEDWKNYDDMIFKYHAKQLGCNPPYFSSIPNIPTC